MTRTLGGELRRMFEKSSQDFCKKRCFPAPFPHPLARNRRPTALSVGRDVAAGCRARSAVPRASTLLAGWPTASEISLPRIVKRDGTREPFDERKLRASLQAAVQKRSVTSDALEAALSRIQRTLKARGERELRAREIGDLVMAELRDLDQVAYVRYASVYRSFQDVNDFREEIERLGNEPTPGERRNQIPLIDE